MTNQLEIVVEYFNCVMENNFPICITQFSLLGNLRFVRFNPIVLFIVVVIVLICFNCHAEMEFSFQD